MMLRAQPITLAPLVGLLLTAAACDQPPPPKPLAERILDKMVERCKAMAPKDEQTQCALSPGLSTLEATNAMHRILVKQGMTMFPRDGHCDRHGLFMICTEKIGEKTTGAARARCTTSGASCTGSTTRRMGPIARCSRSGRGSGSSAAELRRIIGSGAADVKV